MFGWFKDSTYTLMIGQLISEQFKEAIILIYKSLQR